MADVSIKLPKMKQDGGYVPRHVQVGNLNEEQAIALRLVRKELYEANKKLKSGKHIDTYADVIRYLLEQVFSHAVVSANGKGAAPAAKGQPPKHQGKGVTGSVTKTQQEL